MRVMEALPSIVCMMHMIYTGELVADPTEQSSDAGLAPPTDPVIKETLHELRAPLVVPVHNISRGRDQVATPGTALLGSAAFCCGQRLLAICCKGNID